MATESERRKCNNQKSFFCLIYLLANNLNFCSGIINCIEADFILQGIDTSCFVALVSQVCQNETGIDHQLLVEPDDEAKSIKHIFKTLSDKSFKDENNIKFGVINLEKFSWPNGETLHAENKQIFDKDILLFPRVKPDRTCLLSASVKKISHTPHLFEGVKTLETITAFINEICNAYRTEEGFYNIAGLHRLEILQGKFHVSNISSIKSVDVFEDTSQNLNKHSSEENHSCSVVDNSVLSNSEFDTDDMHVSQKCSDTSDLSKRYKDRKKDNSKKIPQCQRIEIPTKENFINNYLTISRPVVIKDAIKQWPAFTKWTNDYLRETYGENSVHIKLTPGGEYEGVESASLWESHSTFKIPELVKQKLLYPDLVVVRPATASLKFSEFLDIVESVSNGTLKNISAYLEYSSIPEHLPELEADISNFEFVQGVLERKHLNIWLSDGNTLGKLHFDPFDNLLCQISGSKEVILFEPHNNKALYESHIPEAILSYKKESKEFRRKQLLESTSMVMSPVDISKPDYQRFPEFANTYPLNCTIMEGDVLFMPAFWWHEVQSYPSKESKRNLAVNFWYEPFLTKEFPCPECQLDVNPKYRHLL